MAKIFCLEESMRSLKSNDLADDHFT